jgi:hypothetical protein
MKLKSLTDVFMMQMIVALGIIAGLAAVSAKAQEGGCDGPVFVAGSVVNTCGTCLETAPHCPGYTDRRDDYYTCGGSGYTYCSQSPQVVGYSGMTCTDTGDINKLVALQMAYDDCLIDAAHGNVPYSSCHAPQYCGIYGWHTCSAGTTGGIPIIAVKLIELGDYTGCMLAKLQKSPSPSVVELALVTLRACD